MFFHAHSLRLLYSMPIQKVYVTITDESSVEHAKQLIQKVMNGETITDDDLK